MKQLLNGKLAPITDSWGFLQAPIETIAETYFSWKKSLPYNIKIRRETASGSLTELLSRLDPLAAPFTKTVWISTQSSWTAYFNNHTNGPDVASNMAYIGNVLKCRALRIECCPNTLTSDTNRQRGRYGGVIFEVAGPDGKPPLMYERSVWATNDGGRWSFGQNGNPFPFEETETYSKKRINERLTDDMLERYCDAMGIRLFDDSFYGPDAIFFPEDSDKKTISLKQRLYDLGIIDSLD